MFANGCSKMVGSLVNLRRRVVGGGRGKSRGDWQLCPGGVVVKTTVMRICTIGFDSRAGRKCIERGGAGLNVYSLARGRVGQLAFCWFLQGFQGSKF